MLKCPYYPGVRIIRVSIGWGSTVVKKPVNANQGIKEQKQHQQQQSRLGLGLHTGSFITPSLIDCHGTMSLK